ncbi:hypothetical protein F373_gp128 [Bacillus phage SP-10]|uniref:hypothetical protein n=1 Tax=Bacillus phage SP10 TaxID=941058 RepID=UPI0002198B54|nr:hypothetical protein F373_gp128 [Bacillus phage SP-10]BAK52940.1 hypothetical protein [Bacillus phage SP-10]
MREGRLSVVYLKEEEKQKRTIDAVKYMMKHNLTMNLAGRRYGLPRSTLHRFIHKHLEGWDKELYDEVIKFIKRRRKQIALEASYSYHGRP